ncbi:ribosomal S17-domain-containing protein [Mycena leptocephala]|nr:ribosomal S17-domain-containing protein [Mycena leptocephala]
MVALKAVWGAWGIAVESRRLDCHRLPHYCASGSCHVVPRLLKASLPLNWNPAKILEQNIPSHKSSLDSLNAAAALRRLPPIAPAPTHRAASRLQLQPPPLPRNRGLIDDIRGHHTVADRAAEAAVGIQVICLGNSTGCVSRRLQRLTLNFHTNKRIIDEVVNSPMGYLSFSVAQPTQAVVPSKQLHNKISGFTTHLLKRIQKGPVRGISFKLQEEERERKDNYVPEVPLSTPLRLGDWRSTPTPRSALLTVLNFDLITILVVVPITTQPERSGPGGGPRQERRIVLGTAPR